MSAEYEKPNMPNQNLLIRFAAAIATSVVAAKDQLALADLNPHEGKLRASAMPVKYMNIPDFPPEQEDPTKQS